MLKSAKILQNVWHPLKSYIRNKPYPTPFINFLNNLPSTEYTKLPNGLTIASETRESYNVTIGLFIDGGSRYESFFENGIAHFFEHIVFKTTKSRNRSLLYHQMDGLGARFNCFTTREMVVFYCECLSNDLPLAVDILADCVYNNLYSSVDIENEKKVVYAEMIERDKNQNEVVFDYLHATAFQDTPLAQPVMGNSSNLHNFTDGTISRYLKRIYDPSRTVLAAVGGVTHDQMLYLSNTYFSKFEPTKCLDMGPYRYTGSEVRFRDDSLPLVNVAMAVEGPSFCDEDALVMDVASAIVGGWDTSQPGGPDHATPLARIASTTHICEAYKSFNFKYRDTALWGVHFLSKTMESDDFVLAVQDVWMNLCCTVTEGEVERAKRELKAKLLSKTESASAACYDIGKWLLYNGYRHPVQDRLCLIDNISVQDVREVCMKYIYDKCPAIASMGPTEALADYTRLRAGMYWLRT